MYKKIFAVVFCLTISGSLVLAYTNSAGSGGYSSFGTGGGATGGLSYGSSGGYGGGGGDDLAKALAGGLSSGGGGGGDYSQPQVIEVSPDQLPVQVHFRTASSRLNVQQSHNAHQIAPQVEHASFQDEPHRVVHEVVKPVIQEVREIIQPYRRVTQEIRPVIEEVHTVVHKGENRRQHSAGSQMQKGYGGGGGGLGGAQYKSKAKA